MAPPAIGSSPPLYRTFLCRMNHLNSPSASSSHWLVAQNVGFRRQSCSNGEFTSTLRKLKDDGCSKKTIVLCATSSVQPVVIVDNLKPLDLDKSEYSGHDGAPESITNHSYQSAIGKPGFVSFHTAYERRIEYVEDCHSNKSTRAVLFIGPTVLVAFLVLPTLYLRKVLSLVFEDSLLTDFLILFFTEAIFYGGVAIFVLLVDLVWRRPLNQAVSTARIWSRPKLFSKSSVVTLVLSLMIPLLTMGMVWPWTGPAASATLAPYLVGLVIQFSFEQYSRHRKSPSWPVIPVIFKVYRLHQLNRAAQLVTALSFSVRGAEATPQTQAITNSLGVLQFVLQILGVICIWSLSSFLMRLLPSLAVPE